MTRRSTAAAVIALVALAVTSANRWIDGERPRLRTLVPDAAFPAAMVALPDGGLLYGERLTGRSTRGA